MKKILGLLFAMIFCFLIGYIGVEAETSEIVDKSYCEEIYFSVYQDMQYGEKKYDGEWNCHLVLDIADSFTLKNEFQFFIDGSNIEIINYEILDKLGYISRGSDNRLTVTLYQIPLSGTIELGTLSIVASGSMEDFLSPQINFNYATEFSFGTCQIIDRDSSRYYYGINGTSVDELTYQKECVTHTCEELSDGTKFGSFSTIVSDLDFQKQCMVNKCVKLSDGTTYGKEGNVVNELTFQKECVTHTCDELSDGTKYGSSGTIVSDLDFQKQCKVNICTVLSDGTYFDASGSIVTKEEFLSSCKSKISCQKIDDKYYGVNGEETTESEYQISCQKNYCKKIGDVYFDSVGNKVSEDVYNISCNDKKNEVENPQTGSSIPLWIFIIGFFVVIGIVSYNKKYGKIYKI